MMKSQMRSYYAQLSPFFLSLSVLLFPVLSPNLFSPLGRASTSIFSEWNAPKPRHWHLLKAAIHHMPSLQRKFELWSPLPDQGWKTCADSVVIPSLPEKSQGYIQVFLDGGLNQQRMGICDAVAVAKILNATLVIPHLETNAVWQDPSSFADIYEVDHFINSLREDVRIVKELPDEYFWSTREYYATGIRETRIKNAPVHASDDWYLVNVLPLLQSGVKNNCLLRFLSQMGTTSLLFIGYGIAAIAPFSHRLAFDNLSKTIQRLRCKVNFKALVFVAHVRDFGAILVNRLRYSGQKVAENTRYQQDQMDGVNKRAAEKYIVLHLRFDKDMAAHSACDFGGGRAEKLALAKYRQVLWQGRVLNSQFTDKELRIQGRCPLTPEEIGLLLAALGFTNQTKVYLSSHTVYGGGARVSTLQTLFPRMEDKKSLTSAKERAKFEGKASLLAAIDYYVSMHSDIFVSASLGNMHNALLGHRAFKSLKAIRPNMMLLGQLFMNESLTWPEFKMAVIAGHKSRQGQIRMRKVNQSIYTYPIPDCMCEA